MVENIKENFNLINDMAMENLSGKMGECIEVNGKMESNMELEYFRMKKEEKKEKVSGSKVKE